MECRVCDSARLELVLDLGMHPWGNHFLTREQIGKEPFYPLRLLYCVKCTTCQLDYTVPKEVMFVDHTYLSGTTKSLRDHFSLVAQKANDRFFRDRIEKSVLDIGSNDGTQLECYRKLGYQVLGVDSSKTAAKIANAQGLTTLNEFFNLDLAKKLDRKFDIINASGVFFHLEELHSVTRGIQEALADEGVFIVQFIYMKGMVDNLAFDQIYHEHLLYYNLKNLEVLLNRHELSLFDAYISPIHGGSVIGYVGHSGKRMPSQALQTLADEEEKSGANNIGYYYEFAQKVAKMKEDNLHYLQSMRTQGKRVFGMGAPVKGNTLLNYLGVNSELVETLVEKNPLRKGLYAPGSHIPIIMEEEIQIPPDVYYVLAWNFKDEILKNNQPLLERGVEFYFPVDPSRRCV